MPGLNTFRIWLYTCRTFIVIFNACLALRVPSTIWSQVDICLSKRIRHFTLSWIAITGKKIIIHVVWNCPLHPVSGPKSQAIYCIVLYVCKYHFSVGPASLPYLHSRPVLVLPPSINLSGLPALELGWHICKLGLGKPSPILEAIFLNQSLMYGLVCDVQH